MKELNESNQLINQQYQHGREQRTRGEGEQVPRLHFRVSTKGKPFSLKQKKEQTRVVHGQNNRTPSLHQADFSLIEEAVPGPRATCLTIPRAAQSGGPAPGASGRTDGPKREPGKSLQLETLLPPQAAWPETPRQLPQREQWAVSPALVQQGHRRQRQVSPLNSLKWEVRGRGGSEYIFWVLHRFGSSEEPRVLGRAGENPKERRWEGRGPRWLC